MQNIVIVGTGTDIGKTVCSALLMSVLKGTYFKPIQSGGKCDNDTNTVKLISELPDTHFLKEKYILSEPLSPHLAAELDNIEISEKTLKLPEKVNFNPLIIELAGGLMVPVNREKLMLDVIQNWGINYKIKVILCALTNLGTINHTLLSIEALKARNIELAGIVFIGEENQDTQNTIIQFSKSKQLGFIPKIENINKNSLEKIFYEYFDVEYFNDAILSL